ncbi:tRNA threonylcarbamoyladenosine biosynthesis protein RimN [Thiohalocapsa marina]|uniref:Threonylcarbamoyl-AMP synthase n=1 Tax=Thiohalocapsa marina TaxID=424902 RepID=A0A5M8FGN1_9GAMM|nr:Sua5/YciO/YrdC/YwlC family protein [Thiohalocapsa marina]KAA6183877.1 tRNA threonylcarbamoyladenosine biosynthesis protein RimN [Thiohalocapsa marina]
MAARALGAGQVVAYPTEAVYGLGCDPRDVAAVRRILAMKQRTEDKGLIVIAADFEALLPFVVPLDPVRMGRILASWPGPSTWLLPARAETPRWLTGRHDTLAVRVTGHPIAAALCRACAGHGGALVSTSANRSSHPPARRALKVRLGLCLGANVGLHAGPDLIVTGACGGDARPSTIRDGQTGRVLRG